MKPCQKTRLVEEGGGGVVGKQKKGGNIKGKAKKRGAMGETIEIEEMKKNRS